MLVFVPLSQVFSICLRPQIPMNIIVMPCCYDGLTAKLIEREGFQLTFMTGFGVSAVHGFADCQLVSYQEMLESAFRICGFLPPKTGEKQEFRGTCCANSVGFAGPLSGVSTSSMVSYNGINVLYTL